MLAEYGTKSLKEVLEPAMQLASGYPIEAQTANSIERGKERIKEWPYSKSVFLPHLGEKREAPEAGEIFVQKDLYNTLSKMVEAEQNALKKEHLAKLRSWLLLKDFTKVISQMNLFVVVRNKADSLPNRIWPTGNQWKKHQHIFNTKALMSINSKSGHRVRRCCRH